MGEESFHCKEDNLSFTGRINLEVPFPEFPAVNQKGRFLDPLPHRSGLGPLSCYSAEYTVPCCTLVSKTVFL